MSTDCVGFTLRRTVRAMSQFYDGILAPSGLRATQVNLLVALGRTGPVRSARLAEVLGMDKTTLSRNLAPLQRARLIELHAGEDRRMRFVALTAKGIAALGHAIPLWQDAQRRATEAVGPERWIGIREDLNRLTTFAKEASIRSRASPGTSPPRSSRSTS
jgi:DNA-binding MarR family transcriptional regulator